MKTGIEYITEERAGHPVRGWTPEHDAEHVSGEIATAAACYASPATLLLMQPCRRGFQFVDPWPWGRTVAGRAADDPDTFHIGNTDHQKRSKSRLRQLQIAGALIAAEMDRLIAAGEQF